MIRWLGHSTVRIDGEHVTIFIDPYLIKERAKSDLVLVSHDHLDHCSLDDLRMVVAKRTHLVGPHTVHSVLRRVSGHVHPIEAGQGIELMGVKIWGVPAYNIEKGFHPKEAGGLGFLLEVDGKRIYFAGDTDLIPEMQYVKADVAILPVGGVYTMDADQAAQAYKIVGATEGVPIHYGTTIGTGADGEKFRRLIGQ